MTIIWRAPSIDDGVAAELASAASCGRSWRESGGAGFLRADAVSKFLDPRLADLRRPDGMADLPRAVDRLVAALGAGETIGVFGDYDVDGVTTAATLASALRAFGGKVIARAASRQGGYGLGVDDVARFAAEGCRVLVTGDSGTSDNEALATGRARASTSSSSITTSCRPGRRRPTRSSTRAAPTTPFRSRGSPRAGSPSTWRRRCAPASAPPSIRASCSIWWRWGRSPTWCRSPTRTGSWSPRAQGPLGAQAPGPRRAGGTRRAPRGTDCRSPGGLSVDAAAERGRAARRGAAGAGSPAGVTRRRAPSGRGD